jgi:NAD(P)-dependent dehydrogenase (short-subunit alcohol dehydrogenase family)
MQKTFVITGSTRGIGLGLARELLTRKHRVAVSGRSTAAVEQAVAGLLPAATDPGAVAGFACEVADRAQVEALWRAAFERFGRVDVWVNNAGISHARQRIGELADADLAAIMETNLIGMMHATQVALTGMRAQGFGTIYNMEGFGSNGMASPGMSLYGASKNALTYFTKCLVDETRDSPVRICYLSPGIVVTDLLRRDMSGQSESERQRTMRLYNILADRIETVTPFLADGIVAERSSGSRVAWLTNSRAARRFFGSMIRKRELVRPEDLNPL